MVAPDFFFSEELLFFVHIRRLEKSFRKMVCSATVWSRYKSSFNLSWSVEIVGFLLCLVPISCLVGLFLMLFWFSLSLLTMGSLICYWYWLLLIHLFSARNFYPPCIWKFSIFFAFSVLQYWFICSQIWNFQWGIALVSALRLLFLELKHLSHNLDMGNLQRSLSPSSLSTSSSSSHGPHPLQIDPELWLMAEKRTQEILYTIQPTFASEHKRMEVIDYIQSLIKYYFTVEVRIVHYLF